MIAEKQPHLHIKVEKKEKAEWEAKAKKNGRSLSSWVKWILNNAKG